MIKVSVIVPCYNEEKTIRLLLDSLKSQSFPPQLFEVIIADGMSTDRTLQEISGFRIENPEMKVSVVQNPARTIPSGLNKAIKESVGEYIVRLDAHSIPDTAYIEKCLEDLEMQLGDNVGGIWEIQPGDKGWISKSIALAAAHPLGVGDAHYRYSNQAGEVDTVPFGAYRRKLIDKIGLYNEDLLTNEDYEFNSRIRQQGGKVWLDPKIRSKYFARPTFQALAQQYWRYGYWKARMIRKNPGTIRWRQALPPLFVMSIILLAILAMVIEPMFWLLGAVIVIYLFVLGWVGLIMSIRNQDYSLIAGIPIAISTMHVSWGSAFLISLILSIR